MRQHRRSPVGTAIGNYGWWLDAIGAVRNANFEPDAHIQAPSTSTSLPKSKSKEATTNAYLRPPDGLLPMLPTKQVLINSTDCSKVYTGQYGFLAYLRADIQPAQPAAFVIDRGVRA